MRINHNIAALNTHRQLAFNNTNAGKSLEKLSSGFRINRAGDDAAGLAISEKMRAQIRGLDMASKNAQDGISLIQTAEGALTETHSILQRMRELAVQSSTDTNKDADRAEIQKEINQLAQEITRIANDTEFNQRTLLNGAIQDGNSGQLTFHIGANSGQNLLLGINALDAATLGVASASTTAEASNATAGITGIQFGNTLGAGVVDGETVSVQYNFTAGGAGTTGSAATATVGGVTVTASGNGADYNGYTITFADNTTEGIAVDHDAQTIVITLDYANTPSTDVSGLTVSVSGTNPIAGGSFSFTGDGSGATAGTTTGTTAGGVTDVPAGVDTHEIVISNGNGDSATIALTNANDQRVTGTGDFAGLSFNVSGITSGTSAAVGSFDLAVTTTAPSAATFNADGTLLAKASAVNGIDVSTQTAADAAITTIQSAIETVSAERSKLGAVQNRLEHTINNLGASAENLTAAESRIRDVDMAKEMMEFTKNNILTQAAQAMLAQANQQPQGVLQLLR